MRRFNAYLTSHTVHYQVNDPSLESQWRALILFGKNSATYKFAFAKSLLELAERETTTITLTDLAEPFSRHLVEHLRLHDKQGSAGSSKFLTACRQYLAGTLPLERLLQQTEQLGFVNVLDAFQVVHNGLIPQPFYEQHRVNGKPQLTLTDHFLRLKESFHFQNLPQEAEARWRLVETAWNLQVSPNVLEVEYDEVQSMFFIERNLMRRVNITSVRDALNGYQKGKCFYSFQDISIVSGSEQLCAVDHFLPHLNKRAHLPANINGVWNLVLADRATNGAKGARVPALRFLQRLHQRNEFFIESKHPLAETIINQTGATSERRRQFLLKHYQLALDYSIHQWQPEVELPGSF
ncbi:HNH endonuclease [Microvirga sp. STR05]|uniref:HNH endonuclease domain-containing protein n=1 Tax=Hymenobacter duratus TaxID=2771356 RepID=UPI001B8D662B|nr:HNH endonuclease domain-containing protein [Hymenobacter duratus]MBR7951634.1 HNH endonuclease [Microvirga sp. STR05]